MSKPRGHLAVYILAALFPLVGTPVFQAAATTQSDIERGLSEHVSSITRAGGTEIVVDSTPYWPARTPDSLAHYSPTSESVCTLQVVSYVAGDAVHNSSKTLCLRNPTTLTMTATVKRFNHSTARWAELARITDTGNNKADLTVSSVGQRAGNLTSTFAASTRGKVWFDDALHVAYAVAVGSFDVDP